MQNNFINGNEKIESAVEVLYKEESQENIMALLGTVAQRMNEGGHLLIPVEKQQSQQGEDHSFAMGQVRFSDGRAAAVAFTKREQIQSDHQAEVISYEMRAVLESVMANPQTSGVVINPWGQMFFLSKEMIKIILENNAANINVKCEDECDSCQDSEEKAFEKGKKKCAVVFSSRTGNTRMLADAVKSVLTEDECIYFGEPDEAALDADLIYVGFWTDKGTCDADTAAFLDKITAQKVYLFGTAGFGGDEEYFDRIMETVKSKLSEKAEIAGSYMCQGKMPESVRQRYVKMQEGPDPMPGVESLIENFDRALSHPDDMDLMKIKESVLEIED